MMERKLRPLQQYVRAICQLTLALINKGLVNEPNTMSTRMLIGLALFVGLAILLAGTIQLLMVN